MNLLPLMSGSSIQLAIVISKVVSFYVQLQLGNTGILSFKLVRSHTFSLSKYLVFVGKPSLVRMLQICSQD